MVPGYATGIDLIFTENDKNQTIWGLQLFRISEKFCSENECSSFNS